MIRRARDKRMHVTIAEGGSHHSCPPESKVWLESCRKGEKSPAFSCFLGAQEPVEFFGGSLAARQKSLDVLFFVTTLISVALLLRGDLWITRHSHFLWRLGLFFHSRPMNRARHMKDKMWRHFYENLSQKGAGCLCRPDFPLTQEFSCLSHAGLKGLPPSPD